MFTINRVVVLLTPVFAGLAGSVAVWVAENFPGAPALDSGELTAIFVAGATSGLGAALSWLKGWQNHEQAQALGELPVFIDEADLVDDEGDEGLPNKPEAIK